MDIVVRAFSVPGLTRDILHPETAYSYLLDIDIIQTVLPSQIDFRLEFFLSANRNMGWDLDDDDVVFRVDLSPSQSNMLKVRAFLPDLLYPFIQIFLSSIYSCCSVRGYVDEEVYWLRQGRSTMAVL